MRRVTSLPTGAAARADGLIYRRTTCFAAAVLSISLSTNTRGLAETTSKQELCYSQGPVRCVAGKNRDEIGAGDVESFILKGNRHARDREYDLAIDAYTEAIRLDPKSFIAFIDRALVYTSMGDYDHALEDFSVAIAGEESRTFTVPLRAYALNSRGRIFLQRAQYDQAVADFTAAIRVNRVSHEVYRDRAEALFKQGRLLEAIADADRALWIWPEFSEAYATRARIYRALGSVAEADADQARANEAQSLGQSASAVYLRSQVYPDTLRNCADGAKHTLLLNISAGTVAARPEYAGPDAHISVRRNGSAITFRLGGEGCRLDVTIAADEYESASGGIQSSTESVWTDVAHTDSQSYEQVFYANASNSCAEATVRMRAYWGYIELKNEYLAPGSSTYGVTQSMHYGRKGCGVHLLTSKVD